MSINWIAEVSRIRADVSRHERVGTKGFPTNQGILANEFGSWDWLTANR